MLKNIILSNTNNKKINVKYETYLRDQKCDSSLYSKYIFLAYF